MPVKSRFRGVFHNKQGKRAQRVLKSAQRYFYHICSFLYEIIQLEKIYVSALQILKTVS